MLPGPTTITSTPNGRSSRRRLSEIASSPNLEAAYGPMKGSARRPATGLMWTTRPPRPPRPCAPAALRSGRNAWVTATAPTRFTSSARRSWSSGSSSSGPAAGIPALFTRPASGAPASSRSTSARARAIAGESVTSIITGVTPACVSAAASDGRRTVPNTRKPRPASSRAMAAPMPVEAPVTTMPGVTRRNLRPPRQRRRARPERGIDVAQRDGGRDGPGAPLHHGHADGRDLAVRPQIDHGGRGVARALVGPDHEGPRSFVGPHPLEGVHALPRGLRELELHRLPLAVDEPLRRPGHDVADRLPVVEGVDEQERAAGRLVVRIGRQLDRNPRRPGERRCDEEGARERREGETTDPGLHGNLRDKRLPMRCRWPEQGLERPRARPADTRSRHR